MICPSCRGTGETFEGRGDWHECGCCDGIGECSTEQLKVWEARRAELEKELEKEPENAV